MAIHWIWKRPLVTVAVLWLAGYAAAWQTTTGSWGVWLLPAGFLLLLPALTLKMTGKGAVLVAAILLLSFGYFERFDAGNRTALQLPGNPPETLDGREIETVGRIISPVEVDGDKAAFLLETASVRWGQDTLSYPQERLQVSLRLLEQSEQAAAMKWKRGDRIRLQGVLRAPEPARNFDGFDYRRYLRLQHIHWLLTVKGTESVSVRPPDGWSAIRILRWNDALRDYLALQLDGLYPSEQSGYMKGLLIGYRADLDPEQFGEFSRLGLTHLLAISGLHVAVFIAVLLWIFRLLRIPRETGQLAAFWALPFYVLLTGASPSVIRAGLMGMIALYAARRQWLKDGLHLLCAAGLAMLLWNPYYLLDVGFQLSFLVTAGLIIGVPYADRLIPVRSKAVKSALSVTFVSQLVSFPLSVYYFNQFSLISWLANLVMVPLVSFVVTPLGSASLLAALLSPQAGKILAWAVVWMNRISFQFVQYLDGWSGFHWIWPSPPVWWIAVYYGTAACIVLLLCSIRAVDESRREGIRLTADNLTRKKSVALFLSTAFAALLVYGYAPAWMQREAAVEFIDVGQGDSIRIRTPEGRTLLVDGGGTLVFNKPGEEWKLRKDPFEVGAKLLVPLLKKRGIHRIDDLIVTHEDTDHIGGLKAVVEQIPIGRILFNGTLKTSKNAQELFRAALDKKIPLVPVAAGDLIRPDSSSPIRVLYPSPDVPDLRLENEQNKESVVFLLEMEKVRFLFAGDVGREGEEEVLRRLAIEHRSNEPAALPPPIDFLKVAHHGSKTSTSPEWLAYWRPVNAVISVGARNVYGHPTAEVLQRLEQAQAGVYRTDRDGGVRVSVRDGAFAVETKLGNGAARTE